MYFDVIVEIMIEVLRDIVLYNEGNIELVLKEDKC